MRTLIKNPMKLLIIVERSKGETSIPEMDKVLDHQLQQFILGEAIPLLSLYANYPKKDPFKPLKVDKKQESFNPVKHFGRNHSCLKLFVDKLAGEVVGSPHNDSDGVGQAAQAEAQGGSQH